jgi:hypothetical protein
MPLRHQRPQATKHKRARTRHDLGRFQGGQPKDRTASKSAPWGRRASDQGALRRVRPRANRDRGGSRLLVAPASAGLSGAGRHRLSELPIAGADGTSASAAKPKEARAQHPTGSTGSRLSRGFGVASAVQGLLWLQPIGGQNRALRLRRGVARPGAGNLKSLQMTIWISCCLKARGRIVPAPTEGVELEQ